MTDDFLSTEDEEDEENSEDESQQSDDAASGSEDSDKSTAAKRIRDLQSKADKAEARANKAEKALAKASTVSAKDKTTGGDVPPEVAEWLKNTQAAFREDLFAEDPRFKQFDLDPALIQGDTPSELRESQKALIEFVDKMEGQIRDTVLVEHGFKPEPKASERQTPVNYATMTSEEFAKHEQAALSGGMLKRSGA